MHNRSFATRSVSSISQTHASHTNPNAASAGTDMRSSSQIPVTSSTPSPSGSSHSSASKEDLVRIFNTAMVSSQAGAKRDFSAELYELTESAAFKAILASVQQLSQVQGIPEKQAAEQVIHTFRKMDEVWNDYLFREGIDRIRYSR